MDFGLQFVSFSLLAVLFAVHAARISGVKDTGKPVSMPAILTIVILTFSLSAVFIIAWGNEAAPLALPFSLSLILGALHPVIALAFFVGNEILRPWELTQNPSMAIIPKLVAGLCILSWLLHSARRARLALMWNTPSQLFIALTGWILLSLAASGEVEGGLSFFGNTVLIAGILFFLVSNVLESERDLRLFRLTLVSSVMGLIMISLYRTLNLPGFSFSVNRLEGYGLTANANDLAALMVLTIPFALVPVLRRPTGGEGRSWTELPLALLASSVFLAGLALSQSRAAMIAVLICGLIQILIRAQNKRLAGLIGIALLPLIPLSLTMLSMFRQAADLTGSSESRFSFLLAGLNMAAHHPFLGVGFNQYPNLFESYAPSVVIEWGQRTAHSSWVLILAETGVMGLVLLSALYWTVLKRAWKIRQICPEYLLSMLGYGITMSFLSHTYTFYPYLLFAFVLAATRAFRSVASLPVLSRESAAGLILPLSVAGLLSVLGPLPAQAIERPVFQAVAGGQKPMGTDFPLTREELTLKGSRGEVLGFQFKVQAPGCLSLDVTDFKLGNSSRPSVSVKVFEMLTIPIENQSFTGAPLGPAFDPLVPVLPRKLCPGTAAPKWYWGDLEIPLGMAPGSYTGLLQLSRPGLRMRIPLKLTVWKMKMPDHPALPAYSELTSWFNLVGHYGKWHEGEAALTEKYADEMVRHRMIPLKSWIRVPELKEGAIPKLNLTDLPTREQSFKEVTLRHRPKSAYYDFPTLPPAEAGSPKADRYFKAIENTLTEVGRPGKGIVYLWDEPDPKDLAAVVTLAKSAKENAPHLKTLVTTTYRPELENVVDIFVPVMEQFATEGYPAPEVYRKLQKAGHEVWWYVSCMSHGCDALMNSGTPDLVIERPASYIRSISWISNKYGIDAFLYYSVNNGYQKYPGRDPWKSLWDFSGNGDGTLFYPGRPGEHGLTEHTPIPSIRLKLWRESSFDAEYLKWIAGCSIKPEWWQREFTQLVKSPREWDRDYTKYQDLRDRMGDFLNLQAGCSR